MITAKVFMSYFQRSPIIFQKAMSTASAMATPRVGIVFAIFDTTIGSSGFEFIPQTTTCSQEEERPSSSTYLDCQAFSPDQKSHLNRCRLYTKR